MVDKLLIMDVASRSTRVAPRLSSSKVLSVLSSSKNGGFGPCLDLGPFFLGTMLNAHAKPDFLQCAHFP